MSYNRVLGNKNGAVFSRLGSLATDAGIVKTGGVQNDAFYKVTAEPLSFAFGFLEWHKLNNSEIKDYDGIYFYWNENYSVRITLSKEYADMIAIDYAQYHMIIHSGTVDYEDEQNTKPYVISYDENFDKVISYNDVENGYFFEYDYDNPDSFYDSHELYLTENFPNQAILFLKELYTDKETGKRLPVYEMYQSGKKNHRFVDDWMKTHDYDYIGHLQDTFMCKNYDEIVSNDPINVTDGDVLVSTRQLFLCVVPDGIKKIGCPVNIFYALALPASVEGFVDENNIDTFKETRDGSIIPKKLEYIFIEASKDEYKNTDLVELIKKHFPDITVLYKGEYDVIGGVYVPRVEIADTIVHVYDQMIATAPYYTGETDGNGAKFYYSCTCCGNHNGDTFYMPLDYHTPTADQDGNPVYSTPIKCGMNHAEYTCAICGEHIHEDIFKSHHYLSDKTDEPCYYCGKQLSDVVFISLSGNGVIDDETIIADSGAYCLEEPEYDKTQYKFLGWFSQRESYDGTDFVYYKTDITGPVPDSMSFYAFFKETKEPVEKHTITVIRKNGGRVEQENEGIVFLNIPTEAEVGDIIEIKPIDKDPDTVNHFVDPALIQYKSITELDYEKNFVPDAVNNYYSIYYDGNVKAFISPEIFIMPDCDVEITMEEWNAYWLYNNGL